MATDNTNSTADVVSTIGPVLYELIQCFQTEFPDTSVVYDENFSYETAVTKWRRDQRLEEGDPTYPPLPLFVFRRTVLRKKDNSGLRTLGQTICQQFDNENVLTYNWVNGNFDVDFLYITKDMNNLENFEITYHSQDGLSEITNLKLSLPEIGDINYRVTHDEPLSDKTLISDDGYYKTISGTFRINGAFFVFKTKSKRILEIKHKVEDFLNTTLQDNTIT